MPERSRVVATPSIVDAYGAYADEHLAEFLRAVPVDED